MFSRVETAASLGPPISFGTIILVPGYVRSPSNSGFPALGLDNFPSAPGGGRVPILVSTPHDGKSNRGLESAHPNLKRGR